MYHRALFDKNKIPSSTFLNHGYIILHIGSTHRFSFVRGFFFFVTVSISFFTSSFMYIYFIIYNVDVPRYTMETSIILYCKYAEFNNVNRAYIMYNIEISYYNYYWVVEKKDRNENISKYVFITKCQYPAGLSHLLFFDFYHIIIFSWIYHKDEPKSNAHNK